MKLNIDKSEFRSMNDHSKEILFGVSCWSETQLNEVLKRRKDNLVDIAEKTLRDEGLRKKLLKRENLSDSRENVRDIFDETFFNSDDVTLQFLKYYIEINTEYGCTIEKTVENGKEVDLVINRGKELDVARIEIKRCLSSENILTEVDKFTKKSWTSCPNSYLIFYFPTLGAEDVIDKQIKGFEYMIEQNSGSWEPRNMTILTIPATADKSDLELGGLEKTLEKISAI